MNRAMNDDAADLRHYAESGSEEAFAAIVQRTLPLVFHAALRRVGGDVHRAEDVTQLVFTALARNASSLARRPDLTGWLFTTTRFLAAKSVRGERRRQFREQAAAADQPAMTNDEPAEMATPLHAVLDDAVMELRELDRQVLLLRFHRGLRLAEIGVQLDATENAVQKRLERALEQLKDKLAHRGITSTAAALAVAFEQQSAIAVPAGLAAAATGAGLACGAGAGGLLAVSSFMMISKLQLGVAAAVMAATSAGLVWEARENAQLRTAVANQAAASAAGTAELRQQLAALTQRAAAAEADAAKLEQAMRAVRTATTASPPRVVVDAAAQATAAINRAGRLAQEGKFQEALDEYLRLYRTLEGARFMPNQQLVMAGLLSLARNYPPARSALRDLRDTAMRSLADQPGNRELVSEIGYLNERLGEGAASIALYDTLPPGDPGRQSLALSARESLVEARRYADALVGTPFGSMMREFELTARSTAGVTGQSLVNTRGFALKGALTNIEVLIGAGQLDDARTLIGKVLAFDHSEATRAAIRQRAERAGHPDLP
jgi:RNA polymerase sigma factor (sigma-70 family)